MSVFWDDDARRIMVVRRYERANFALRWIARTFGTEYSFSPIGTTKWYRGYWIDDTFFAVKETEKPVDNPVDN